MSVPRSAAGSQSVNGHSSMPPGTQEANPSIAEPQLEKILLATDNHIGYAEKDPIRGQDAINTFREILQLAKEMEVDFILLAGDLFHENRPSRACLHQTIALLREYTLGDRPIGVELLSDPMDGKASGFSFPAVNYEDPNLNIAIPVFSIHGNHDDPQGTGPEGALCALDILSVSGVLNYFGKLDLASDEQLQEEAKGIKIKPILLRKGTSHLAMYGCGNVKDARMHYELRSNRVKMFMPEEGEEEWFNMLLVHQNRVKHGPQESVPEGMFDNSFKLVVWGHEHDCRIWPEKVADRDYYITQPGSSVATSLAPGEALPKHVGLLSIQGGVFQIAEIPLKTVRPFELDEVVLSEAVEEEEGSDILLDDKDTITAYLKKRVAELIQRAQDKWDEIHADDDEEMMLPLIRLKVETTGVKEMTNPVRFGQAFIGKVANPKDILQYYRKRKPAEKKSKVNADAPDLKDEDDDEEDVSALTTRDKLNRLRMHDLVQQHLKAQNLEILVEDGMEDAVMRFVEKDDRDAIKDFVASALKNVGKTMRGQTIDEDDVEERIAEAKKTSVTQWAADEGQAAAERAKSKKGKAKASKDDDSMVDSMEEEDDMDVDEAPPPARKAAASRAKAKAPARGKAKEKLFLDDEADDDDDDEVDELEDSEEEVAPKPKKRAAPAKKAPAAKKAPVKKAPAKKAGPSTQSQLNFGTTGGRAGKKSAPIELDSDE